jgi:hypothetical protein
VIEHVEEEAELPQLERFLFSYTNAPLVIVTTPNYEYNTVIFPNESSTPFRHYDHKFEWNRSQFSNWCNLMSNVYGYQVEISGVGSLHNNNDHSYGYATQTAVFRCNHKSEQKSNTAREVLPIFAEIQYTDNARTTNIMNECIYAYHRLVQYDQDNRITVKHIYDMLGEKCTLSLEDLYHEMNKMIHIFVIDDNMNVEMIENTDSEDESISAERQPYDYITGDSSDDDSW